jgi:hypothetical protein
MMHQISSLLCGKLHFREVRTCMLLTPPGLYASPDTLVTKLLATQCACPPRIPQKLLQYPSCIYEADNEANNALVSGLYAISYQTQSHHSLHRNSSSSPFSGALLQVSNPYTLSLFQATPSQELTIVLNSRPIFHPPTLHIPQEHPLQVPKLLRELHSLTSTRNPGTRKSIPQMHELTTASSNYFFLSL